MPREALHDREFEFVGAIVCVGRAGIAAADDIEALRHYHRLSGQPYTYGEVDGCFVRSWRRDPALCDLEIEEAIAIEDLEACAIEEPQLDLAPRLMIGRD